MILLLLDNFIMLKCKFKTFYIKIIKYFIKMNELLNPNFSYEKILIFDQLVNNLYNYNNVFHYN